MSSSTEFKKIKSVYITFNNVDARKYFETPGLVETRRK